jgi:glutaredoxin 3
MKKNIVYCSDSCPFCQRAYKLLGDRGIPFKKIYVDGKQHMWNELREKTGKNTVPQIFINGSHIGGFNELYATNLSGKLDEIVNA